MAKIQNILSTTFLLCSKMYLSPWIEVSAKYFLVNFFRCIPNFSFSWCSEFIWFSKTTSDSIWDSFLDLPDIFGTQQTIQTFTVFENTHYYKIQFWQNPNIFTSFSSKFFLTIFVVKSKLYKAKKSKTTTFHEFFTQKNRQFSRKIIVENLDKKWRFRSLWLDTLPTP